MLTDDDRLAALLRRIVAERHEAYEQGRLEERRAFKQGSLAVCRALDWKREAAALGEVERARAYRAWMLDPTPRPGDYLGRAQRAAG